MQLIDRLEQGECGVLMVDGPRGPRYKAKGGIVKIAQAANVPIVPMTWYSPQWNFMTAPSWDKLKFPVGPTKDLCLFGDPIYPAGRDEQEVFAELQASLEDIDRRAPELYKQAQKEGLWKSQHSK